MRTRTTINFTLFSVAVAALMTSCGGPSGDFKTDATTGVQYRFINHDENGVKPAEGSFARIQMVWTGKTAKGTDTVFIDSHKKGFGDSNGVLMQAIPLKKSFVGCLEQGIMMMAKGDSAQFKVNGDSLYAKTFRYPAERIPAYVKNNPTFTFSIKLVSFQTQQEMMAQRQADMQKRMEAAQGMKTQEPANIAAYLQKNYPNAKPDADSVFYLENTKGKGKQVKEGDSLEVKYVGTFLDGNVFDRSDKGGTTNTFKFQYTKQIALIKGWISVLGKMHEGDKVKVLIPSNMAYGPQGRGQIQPYTPLVFEMELVSIKSK